MHTQTRLPASVDSLPRVPGTLQVDTSLVSTHDEAPQLLALFLKQDRQEPFYLGLATKKYELASYLCADPVQLVFHTYLLPFLSLLYSSRNHSLIAFIIEYIISNAVFNDK